MNMFIGLDVSLASTAVCVLDERGKVMKESKVDSEPAALIAFLRGLSGSVITTGLEAGPLSQWLHRHLTEAGFKVVRAVPLSRLFSGHRYTVLERVR